MQITGRLYEIIPGQAGSNLEADAVAGETLLPVTLASDYDEAGGQVMIDGLIYDYSDVDHELDTITISPGLAGDVEVGSLIAVFPNSDATIAMVNPDDLDSSTQLIEAYLDHSYKAMFSAQRWEDNTGPVVTLDDQYGPWYVVQVHDYEPKLVADSLEGRVPEEVLSDGDAPVEASVPVPISGLGSVFIRTTAVENPDPVTYEYHISTNPSFVAVPRDPATLLAETNAIMISTKTLADGTPLAYDTQYYVVVIVRDADGPGPQSDAVPVTMSKVDRVDMVAHSITAEEIAAIVTLSMLFRTAEIGERIEIGTDQGSGFQGIRVYDSTGACVINLNPSEALFAGNVLAKHLESMGATLHGLTEGTPGGEFELQASVIEAPSFAPMVDTVPAANITLAGTTPSAIAKAPDSNRFYAGVPFGPNAVQFSFKDLVTGADVGTPNVGYVGKTGEAFDIKGVATKTGYRLVWGEYGSAGKIRGVWFGDGITDSLTSTAANPEFAAFAEPAAPGVGGYNTNEPIYGFSQNSSHILVAHRVKGDQTIGGVAYLNNEVMIRAYSYTNLLLNPIPLTLVRTIRTGLYPSEIKSILCNNVGAAGSFDLPTTANRAGYLLSGSGLGLYGAANWILEAPITGATVDANIPASGPSNWYGGAGEAMYIGGVFYAAQRTNRKSIDKFNGSDAAWVAPRFAYTYFKTSGSQETKMSPITTNLLFKRFKSKWTIPALPEGVSEVRVYVSRDDTRTNFQRFDTKIGTPGLPLALDLLPPNPPAGAAALPPPSDSTFVSGDPYEIYAKTGGFIVRGDSTGAWPYIMPVGTVLEHHGVRTPAGFLPANGNAFLRVDYPSLAEELSPNLGAPAFTSGNSLLTLNDHRIPNGMKVMFSGGTMPTGLTALTTYWATVVSNNTIRLSSSLANFIAGTFITPSTSGSGSITAWAIPHGNPGNTTSFFTPNRSGKMAVGSSTSDNDFLLGMTGGAKEVTLTISQIPSHNHGGSTGNTSVEARSGPNTGTNTSYFARGGGASSDNVLGASSHSHGITAQGGGLPHENMSPFYAANFIIKF